MDVSRQPLGDVLVVGGGPTFVGAAREETGCEWAGSGGSAWHHGTQVAAVWTMENDVQYLSVFKKVLCQRAPRYNRPDTNAGSESFIYFILTSHFNLKTITHPRSCYT